MEHFTTTNETKANFAERVIKTLKSKLTRYMHNKNTNIWIDALPKTTKSYNSTYHRSIKMSPNKAVNTDDTVLWQIQYTPKPIQVKREIIHPPKTKNPFRFKVKVNDKVRLSFLRSTFQRQYDEGWTTEIYIVSSRKVKQNLSIYTVKIWN